MNISVRNTETDILRLISGGFKRHPLQVNRILEADAEIIRLPGNDEAYLVVKTDGIHEEIREKLYEDAYLIGWMMVTAPVSDIAAVGATPTGILLSLILPRYFDEVWLNKFSNGVRDACNRYKIYVLGGDTNFDTYFSVSATVIANIFNQPPLMRTGIKAGDYLYSTSLLGVGNAYAYSRFFDTSFNVPYQPFAKLDEANMIARYASSCIDTSDGLFPALAVLAE